MKEVSFVWTFVRSSGQNFCSRTEPQITSPRCCSKAENNPFAQPDTKDSHKLHKHVNHRRQRRTRSTRWRQGLIRKANIRHNSHGVETWRLANRVTACWSRLRRLWAWSSTPTAAGAEGYRERDLLRLLSSSWSSCSLLNTSGKIYFIIHSRRTFFSLFLLQQIILQIKNTTGTSLFL